MFSVFHEIKLKPEIFVELLLEEIIYGFVLLTFEGNNAKVYF